MKSDESDTFDHHSRSMEYSFRIPLISGVFLRNPDCMFRFWLDNFTWFSRATILHHL